VSKDLPKAYKMSDMDRLLILADEYEELEKHSTGEQVLKDQVGVQVTCRRYEE